MKSLGKLLWYCFTWKIPSCPLMHASSVINTAKPVISSSPFLSPWWLTRIFYRSNLMLLLTWISSCLFFHIEFPHDWKTLLYHALSAFLGIRFTGVLVLLMHALFKRAIPTLFFSLVAEFHSTTFKQSWIEKFPYRSSSSTTSCFPSL